MKITENLLIKLIVIHLLLLLAGQWIVSHDRWQPYVNKTFIYEGVSKIALKEPVKQ